MLLEPEFAVGFVDPHLGREAVRIVVARPWNFTAESLRILIVIYFVLDGVRLLLDCSQFGIFLLQTLLEAVRADAG